MCFVVFSGSFAVVKQATRKADGKQFAIKIIKKSKLNAEELAVVHDEVEIMHKVNTNTNAKTPSPICTPLSAVCINGW